MNKSEYYQSAVGYGACAYSTLGTYNADNTVAPVPTSNIKGVYTVPAYTAPGYNTLTHGDKANSCGGYFKIGGAYGVGAGKCNQKYFNVTCGMRS